MIAPMNGRKRDHR